MVMGARSGAHKNNNTIARLRAQKQKNERCTIHLRPIRNCHSAHYNQI